MGRYLSLRRVLVLQFQTTMDYDRECKPWAQTRPKPKMNMLRWLPAAILPARPQLFPIHNYISLCGNEFECLALYLFAATGNFLASQSKFGQLWMPPQPMPIPNFKTCMLDMLLNNRLSNCLVRSPCTRSVLWWYKLSRVGEGPHERLNIITTCLTIWMSKFNHLAKT